MAEAPLSKRWWKNGDDDGRTDAHPLTAKDLAEACVWLRKNGFTGTVLRLTEEACEKAAETERLHGPGPR